MLETIMFGLFGGLLLSSAIMVISAYNTIHRALWLVLTFMSASALWITLNAEFLGLMLILVYVGAVLTLFLFVVMTLSTVSEPNFSTTHYVIYYGLALTIISISLGCTLYSLYDQVHRLPTTQSIMGQVTESNKNTYALGIKLYTDYIYPFELAGILLLVAIIVSISLHRGVKSPGERKNLLSKQEQIQIKREDRVQLLSGD